MNVITSTSNAQVRRLIQLQKKARERSAEDVFVAEGLKMYREAPRDRITLTCVSESFYRRHEPLFAGDKELLLLSDRVFEAVSDTRTPQGVLCLIRQYHYSLADLTGGRQRPGKESPAPALLMILENLQDPGNAGTILRTAEGAGVTGILLGPGCVDLYNPKTIRSTMGSIYRMPFVYAEDLGAQTEALKREGVRIYAAHLQGSVPYDTGNYTGPSGFLIGNESRGLTEETAALADARIRIPMCGQVESLNAAVAASVLMYEANRQRRGQNA